MPKVSVVTTLYNQGKYLKDAIDSLDAQTLKDWECIIVDDGSSDDSLEIALRLVGDDKRFKVVTKENSGVAGARNFGIALANGEYLAYLDSDDYLYPENLETLCGSLDDNRNANLATARVQETHSDLSPCGKMNIKYNDFIEDRVTFQVLASDPLARILWNNPTKPGAEMWRTSTISELGYDENLKINEDWDLLIRYAKAGGAVCPSMAVVAKYRRHHGSLIDSNRDSETWFSCFEKNFSSTESSCLYAEAAELVAVLMMASKPEDHVCWKVLNKSVEDYALICENVLNDPNLKKFGTLWLGGTARTLRLPEKNRWNLLVQKIAINLSSKPYTYKVAFHRTLERARDWFNRG